jgi:flagellar assembly protein FliH
MTDTTAKAKARVIPGEGSETAYQRWELPHLLTANQMERIQKQAHEEGFARGRAEGLAAAQQETRARLDRLGAIIATLATPLKELDDRIEQELVTLALAAARLIVRRELKTDPGPVVAAVREAMNALPAAARQIRLHLHPDDAQLVREYMKVGDDEQRCKIVEDPVQTRGGCKVITEHSRIDASVEARLTAILATILGGERADDRAG